MKLISFVVNGDTRIGAVVGDTVVDLNATLAKSGQGIPSDMAAFLAQGQSVMNRAKEAVQQFEKGGKSAVTAPLSSVTLLAPIPRPPKIMMGGRNYLKHIDELRVKTGEDIPVPPFPRIFSKYHTSVTGPGMPVIYPKLSKMVDFEGELTQRKRGRCL
jgi:2-keto-4-pentenoate hydratase/2-oxohepta-3-ene-1,7-dioic acid hydratase in catechol pathway